MGNGNVKQAGREIKSDQTLFDIIETIRDGEGASLQEISERLNLAKSTVHAHLNVLLNRGFVTRKGDTYHIGLRFLEFGIHARDRRSVRELVQPKIKELAAESGETAWFVVEENGYGVFVEHERGEHGVRSSGQLGARLPLYKISSGKAILAALPRSEAEAKIEKFASDDGKLGGTTKEEIVRQLDQIRDEKVAYNWGDTTDGMHAASTAISDDQGDVHGAIGVSGAALRLTRSRCKTEISDLILTIANEIELNLIHS